MKKLLFLFQFSVITTCSFAQNVNIPDANFKAYLVGNASINTNADTEIQLSEAQSYTGQINCTNLGITDLTGIEAFDSLNFLDCSVNALTTIDVSQNTLITYLNCRANDIDSLDTNQNTELLLINCGANDLEYLNISQNINLLALTCSNNSLDHLDLTQNVNLANLFCDNNDLDSLDLSQNTLLELVNCNSNSLSDIDFTQNPNLETLYCGFNPLMQLDVSSNVLLEFLYCVQSTLTTIDVSQNIVLTKLYCNNNALTTIDLSQNTMLDYLACRDNILTTLDVSNNLFLDGIQCDGNLLVSLDFSANNLLVNIRTQDNPNLSSFNLANGNNVGINSHNFSNCPNLYCIEVDDVSYSTTNWTNVDSTTSFSLDCASFCVISIPDANFKANLLANAAINTNSDTEIQCSEAAAFAGIIDCSNSSITDLTGIEAFTALTELYCYSNALTTIDVSQNTALSLLDCTDNNLSNVDLSANTNLLYFYGGDNQLTSLDVTSNVQLIELVCGINQISNIDVSVNTSLEKLYLQQNQLTSLDISTNALLNKLWCFNNQLTTINGLANKPLKTFFCYENQLSALNLATNADLLDLRCNDNSITQLNVANGNNTAITQFYSFNNPNLTCIQVDDSTYSANNWSNIDAQSFFSLDCNFCFTSQFTIDTSICEGGIYTSPNQGTYTTTGIIYDTIQNFCGGDSIITINLNVNMVDSTVLASEDFCSGETLDFYGTTISSSGTYYHTLLGQNDCDSILVKTFNEISVNVMITNNNGTLEATAGLDTYQWYQDGVAITNATNSAYTPSENGDYYCEVEFNGCVALSNSVMIDLGTSINSLTFQNLSIYPNPTNGSLYLETTDDLSSIRILDLSGKVLKTFSYNSRIIDISEFVSGFYLLEIANMETKSFVKIIKK